MKVEKTKAVAFLVALGFSKAAEWDENKLRDRLSQVPNKVDEDDVPEEFTEFYSQLLNSAADDEIEFTREGAESAAPFKKEKKVEPRVRTKKHPAKSKPAPKAAVKSKKKTRGRPAKEPQAVIEKSEIKRGRIPLDAFGHRVGTISSQVLAAISSGEWKEEYEIVRELGIPLRNVRTCLNNSMQRGGDPVVESRRLVQYRIVPAKK